MMQIEMVGVGFEYAHPILLEFLLVFVILKSSIITKQNVLGIWYSEKVDDL